MLTRNFALCENVVFQEVEHAQIFEVFPRKSEKCACEKSHFLLVKKATSLSSCSSKNPGTLQVLGRVT